MTFLAGFPQRTRSILSIILACTVAGCEPPESVRDELMGRLPDVSSEAGPSSAADAAPGPELPPQPAFTWKAVEQSKVVSAGPPATLQLSSGYAYVLYPTAAVSPGDDVIFAFRASGRAGQLRSVLMRHCGSGSAGDSDARIIDIGEAAADYKLNHLFKEAHPCLRVTFQATTGPNTVTIHSWQLSVSPKPSTPPATNADATAKPADQNASKPPSAN